MHCYYSIYSKEYLHKGLVLMECLKYCRKKLIDCNFDDYKGSWNDQLYVTDWPERFNNIGVVKNPGINLTPFEVVA